MVQLALGRIARPLAGICVCSLAIVPPAVAQHQEWTAEGVRYYEGLGTAITSCGDVDGDGLPDLLVGAVPSTGEAGKAFVYSSATPHAMLLEFDGDAANDGFGRHVGALGDIDGDGVEEYAIAAPDRVVTGAPKGAIFVWSGTGTLLRTITSTAGTQVGLQMVVLGDVDGDGVRDLLYNDTSFTVTVVLESGATGATIRTHTDPAGAYGIVLGRTGDADGDGVEDYVICDRRSPNGKIHVYSGSTGAHLYANAGSPSWVGPAGDADADGYGDLLYTRAGSGAVTVISAATATLLHVITWGSEPDFGLSASTIGDLDGDGADDLVATRSYDASDPFDPHEDLEAFSGATGGWIGAYSSGAASAAIKGLDATTDVDGDGIADLLVGAPTQSGQIRVLSGANGNTYVIDGVGVLSQLGVSLAVIGDRDGDGWREVALLSPGGVDAASSTLGAVQIVSGRDGHELSHFSPASQYKAGKQGLTSVGDVDGDGSEEVALVTPVGVEVHSGADDSLMTTIVTPSGTPSRIAAAAEVGGAPLLAITTLNFGPPEFFVYDLAAGAFVTQLLGSGGGPIACMGDVDQDGLVDWLVTDTYTNTFGVVTGGATPVWLWSASQYVPALTSVRDLDGDAIDDVLLGEPSSSSKGKVTAFSGVDGSKLFEVTDMRRSTWFGDSVASLGDLNRDGFGDFAVGAWVTNSNAGAVHVFSGRTATRLFQLDGSDAYGYLGVVLPDPRWHEEPSLDPDAIPDLVSGGPYFELSLGRAQAFRLDDLFLQITPPSAPSSTLVTLLARGGPTGNVAALYAVDFSGTPLNFFLALGTFNVIGNFAVSGTVPSGLSGNTLTLRAYGVGFTGKVVDSQDMTLTFE